ncbi:hypothetical protein WDU94_001295 [Cyamophila willieti]
MDIITGLLNITDMLNQGHGMLKELDWHSIVDLAQHINEIESLLDSKSVDKSNYKQLDIYIHLKDELCLLQDNLLNSTLDEFKSNILWWEVFQDETTHETKKIVIKVNQQEQRKNYVQCLYLMDALGQEISVFSNYLLTQVLKPISLGMATVNIVKILNHVNIQIEFKSGPGATTQARSVQESSTIIENLLMIFNALYSYLHFHLDPDFNNDTFDETHNIASFYTKMGSIIAEPFVTDLTQSCLNDAIPTTPCKTGVLDHFLQLVQSFEMTLKDTGFLSLEQSSPFGDFKKENMNTMMINKKCTMYLAQARDIMKKPLQVMKQVEPRDVSQLMNATLDHKIVEAIKVEPQDPNNSLCVNLFQFPKCFVSESTMELLDLTQALLADLCTQQDTVCNKLCHTLLNIFIMYCDVVPLYHQKLLDKTPEVSALLHNNCMYVAHHLCTLSDTYRDQVAKSQAQQADRPIRVKYDLMFVDLVVMLRNLSKETLNKQLDVQRNLLRQYVKQSGLNSISTQLQLSPSVEKELRSALSQLRFLRTAWENILPRHVYARSMGSLVTCLIKEVITCLVNTPDISSHVCQALLLLFDMIQDQVTALMPEDIVKSKFSKFIKNWNKFLELIKIFNSTSPRDIEDGWNCGRGPLAQEFSAGEVKNLVRALIQASERREALLERIN